MGDIAIKIQEIRENLGLSQSEFANKLGVTPAHINRIEKNNGLPSFYLIKRIADIFNVDRKELEKILENELNLRRRKEKENKVKMRLVPVLNSISAGKLLDWGDQGYPPGWADEWIEIDSGVTDPNAFALRVDGDSMEPEFHKGEYVVVAPNVQWENGDYVVVANSHDGKALKKIKINRDHIILISLNPKYEPIVLGKDDDPRVIGKVVRKVKKY